MAVAMRKTVPRDGVSRLPLARDGYVSCVSLWRCTGISLLQRNRGPGDALKRKRAEALTTGGRRTREESRVPGPKHRAHLGNRRGRANLDQKNHGRRYGNRRGRMQHSAQRAMVGIAVVGMDVGHLDNGKQREQGQADNTCHRHSAPLLTRPVLPRRCPTSAQIQSSLFKEYTD